MSFNQVVGGSNPPCFTKGSSNASFIIYIGNNNTSLSYRYADVAELADALDLGSSGRPWGFESLHPH